MIVVIHKEHKEQGHTTLKQQKQPSSPTKK